MSEVCEWRKTKGKNGCPVFYFYNTGCKEIAISVPMNNICLYCGKPIKVVKDDGDVKS